VLRSYVNDILLSLIVGCLEKTDGASMLVLVSKDEPDSNDESHDVSKATHWLTLHHVSTQKQQLRFGLVSLIDVARGIPKHTFVKIIVVPIIPYGFRNHNIQV
jgi:hypothetical protein